MAGGKLIYGGGGAIGDSDMDSFFAQNQRISCSSSQPRDSLFMSSSSSSSFLGSRSILCFQGLSGGKRSSQSFYQSYDQEEKLDEELNEYFCQPEKKRRLTADQVLFLEKSFEDENKLEPERKVELAKELGLQPRQIAVWFQNRRARWKTKQLEKDYDALQARYNSLKADYDNILKEKESLKAEVVCITDKLLLKEKEDENSKSSQSSSLTAAPPRGSVSVNLAQVVCITDKLLLKEKEDENSKSSQSSSLTAAPPKGSVAYSVSEEEVSKVSAVTLKLEDVSCGKSDVLDSDSPPHTDGVHSSLMEPSDSSYVFEHDPSDLSQDEEDEISKNLLHPVYNFPKIEDTDYCDMPNSCYYGFPVDDQGFGVWSY